MINNKTQQKPVTTTTTKVSESSVYLKKSELPKDVSSFRNDAGYITSSSLAGAGRVDDPPAPDGLGRDPRGAVAEVEALAFGSAPLADQQGRRVPLPPGEGLLQSAHGPQLRRAPARQEALQGEGPQHVDHHGQALGPGRPLQKL